MILVLHHRPYGEDIRERKSIYTEFDELSVNKYSFSCYADLKKEAIRDMFRQVNIESKEWYDKTKKTNYCLTSFILTDSTSGNRRVIITDEDYSIYNNSGHKLSLLARSAQEI